MTKAEGIFLSFCTHAHYDHWEASGGKVKVQELRGTDDHWTHQVMMNCSYFSLDCTLDYVLTHDQAVSGEQQS